MKDKAKMVERVLWPLHEKIPEALWHGHELNFDALAKQAIVIECEVKHKDVDTIPWTGIKLPIRDIVLLSNPYMNEVNLSGHHGTPGKALAIIVPLADE